MTTIKNGIPKQPTELQKLQSLKKHEEDAIAILEDEMQQMRNSIVSMEYSLEKKKFGLVHLTKRIEMLNLQNVGMQSSASMANDYSQARNLRNDVD